MGKAIGPTVLRLRTGQVALLLIALLGIGALAGWSVYSSTPHQVEKLAILAESNDAASLAYSQRESFNLAISLEKWVRSDLTIRDVEISRALLGQRLQVTLVNGNSTYDVMTSAYKRELAVIDSFIRTESSKKSSNRVTDFLTLSSHYENFLTETRRMSKSIQQESLKQVNKVVRERTRVEFYQSGILLFVILTSFVLAWWITRDLIRTFRTSRQILDEEQKKLGEATEMLTLTRSLDYFQGLALGTSLENKTDEDFALYFEEKLRDAIPATELTVRLINGQYALEFEDNTQLSDRQYEFIYDRFTEIIQLHLARTRLHFEAQYRAHHDLLTGFLNERGFATRYAELNVLTTNTTAAIFIDIDRFHRINDSMGFEYGDSVILEVANRLRELTSTKDTLVKLSSDEFLVIRHCESETGARSEALKLQSALQFTVTNKGIEFKVTFTLGLVIFAPQELTSASLLHRGALARNIAQRQIRSGFAIYSSDQGQEYVESLAEEFALRQAIKLNEFELYYQPVIELTTHEVIGGEALIRWNRPGFGLVYPDEFLPSIRDLDLHVELGEWVIEHSLRLLVNARLFENELSHRQFRVGINIDPEQLKRPNFADFILEKTQKYGIQNSAVSLEVTEHALVETDIAFQQLQRLKSLGFVIAVDDFGTGYSNLAQVQNLPISVLKIDKSFLIPAPGKKVDQQLVIDIKQLADNLNLRVIAEGVEDQTMENFLLETGITRVQGYHYSKPLPEKDFWGWVFNFESSSH